MHIKKRLRRYISNIISFTNSHTRNTLRDRSADFYANEVTDELVDLMRKVWLPIVGPGYEIIVLHIHKSRGTSNLGISIEGVTYVAEPDFDHENLSSTTVTTNSQIEDKSNSSSKLLPNGMAKSAHSNDIKYSDMPSRHFVQYIVPDGLVGSLGVVQKGDELLQANGHRIHGTTHTSTLRYLRNLPSRIELVFARRKSTYENGGDDVFSITGGKDQLIDVAGESLLEVAASEIGSVDTGSSMRIVNAYDNVDRSIYSSPVSPATAHKRVTEWIRKSQGDLSATIDYSSSPESSVTKQTNNKSERFNYCDLKHPLNNYVNPNYTSKLQQQYPVNTMKNNRKYSLPSTMQRSETQIHSRTLGRLPISRSGKVCMEKQSTEQHDHRRCQTLPHYHHNRPNRIDPRYGFKRPCWSSVPLIIQLNKTTHGFGFSIAEYEELPVTDLEGNTLRKAYSLDRRSSNIIGSDRRSFHSYHSTGSTIASLSSLPGKNSKSSSRLKRRSTWSSRSKSHGILLVDSLTPGGIAQLDGRISIGDRLLFVNDKNLMKSSVSEAATTLKSLPNGPCLIGIAKMQLESNETDDIHEKSQQQLLLPYPVVSSRPSVIGMFPDTGEMKKISVKSDLAYPLHVNTGDSTIDNDDNNTIMNGLNATGTEDLALDFYTLPLLCPNPQLHAPDLQYVTPVDPTLEISERLERGSLPIGLKLDALACHGQDGCRVVQVLGGGAVARDQVLVTNDYITSLNGLSMRYLDNLKAFEILHSLSQNSAVIHITYFPASVIESHRIKCLSKTLNQTSENPLQRSSFPYSSIVQPINWSPPVAIVLHRLDTSQPWGLVVSGSDICSKLNCSAPMNLENPSIVSEILPNSVGKNCKLLSRGLLILQIQDIDVSTKGPNYVNAYLQYLSDQPGLREIHIVVCHFNDDCTKHIINGGVAEMFNPGNQVNITNYTTSTTTTTNNNFTDKMELSNYLNISTPINGQLICDHIVHPGTSPSSSDMEDPEPLTDMESRDVVDILSRSVPSPDPNNSSDSQHNTYRKTTLCPLSQLSSPILKDEDNAVNTDVIFSTYEKSDKKSILQNGWVSDSVCSSSSPSFPPPPLPSRRLSTTSKEQEATGYLKPMVVNDSNVNELNFYSPVKLYTRDSQDEILVIRLPLLINSSSNYTHNVNEETENLGFHLVSCSNPESMATFVASCQTDSSGGLECGDEIIQVEDINVCGLDHISVQHIIHSKITELMLNKYSINNSSNNYFIGNDNNGKVSDSDQSVIKSFITLIIRRNPKNLSLMSFSRECNDSPLSVDNLTGSTCSKALSSSSPNPLPTGSKPIPHTFLKEIMVELNEDFWKFQLFDIILERGSDGFGIFIVNLSPNNEPGVFVSEIRPNSPAQLQGVLRPHDRILAIDGQLQCDYESTLELLQKSRKSVRLTIGRQIPCHSDSQQMLQFGYVTTTGDNPDNDTKHHKLSIIPGIPATVTLYKTDGGLGFSIVGGSDTVLSNILVHEVHSGGAAARDGRLQVGDRLLAVNGIDLREATQKDATKIIRTADDCIQLVVYRDPEPQYINQGVFECHNVHLKRDMPGQSFGLSLIGRPHYSTGTAIGGIIENSPAARSNLLEVGDIILEINGWDMRLAKSDEVVNLLKNAHSDVKLLIGRYKTGPSMHAYPRNRLNVYVVVLERRQFGFCNDRPQAGKPYSNDPDILVDSVCQKTDENELHDLKSSTNCITVNNNQKISDDDGNNNNDEIASAAFGLRIRYASSQELWDSHIRLIVDSIQHDSPADRLGMIMPGDRLLSIDREPVDWLNPTEVVQLLANLLYCTIELGRLPYFNAPLSANNNAISDKCFKPSPPPVTSSLSPSHRIQQDEHDMFPPYPPPSLELPTLFGGIMPCIETPSFLRDMCTLPELQDEDDESKNNKIKFGHRENDNHYRLPESTYCAINSSNQQDQIDSMLNMTPLNEEEIEKALELAGRGSGGFFVRQIYLPAAPVNTNNNTNSSHISNIHLGLRLVSGPGVSGPVVVRIEPNSCASRTDIQIGDRILGLDDKLLLSLRQDNHSADDILCTIENDWITRSINSQLTYEQNPCCLTIISYHSLPLGKQENDSKIEEKNSNKNLENNAQLTESLTNLHLTNGNTSNCQHSISSIDMGNPKNHVLSDTTTPLPFESKSPMSKFQQNGGVGHHHSDEELHPNSPSLHNHRYELSLEPSDDVIHRLPNKNLFVDDAIHVICENASTTTNKNNGQHSSCVESVSSLSTPPPDDDGVMCNRPLMNINRKFSIQNNQYAYNNNGIMNNKACL
ncbi:unnamed protein product [Schistosoma margrebowiei]|uniref:PDZ domain-containing protein n=1 Tax=Schistosoma margrebowiei TaxID=48269 RepID=A0AA85AFW4_9TREM|nr:unnamed protein product [Schistosoma margrebowiei]